MLLWGTTKTNHHHRRTHSCRLPRGWTAVMLWLVLVLALTAATATAYAQQQEQSVDEMTCEADGTCTTSTSTTTPKKKKTKEVSVRLQNDSNFRVDVWWDDGRFGSFLTTLEVSTTDDEEEEAPPMMASSLNVFIGHTIFVTRHGVRENLFVDEEPLKFTATLEMMKMEDPVWIIPSHAAPSPNPCQDRYSICEAEAARGSCQSTPGWMIVHCCQACDALMDAARLIDPKVRCAPEHLNLTDPVWKAGDLHQLFEEWYV